MPLQVAFVCHDDDGDRGRLPASTYLLQLLLDDVEAAAITHVVDEDHPVSPLQLFVADGGTLLSGLWRKQTHKLKIHAHIIINDRVNMQIYAKSIPN